MLVHNEVKLVNSDLKCKCQPCAHILFITRPVVSEIEFMKIEAETTVCFAELFSRKYCGFFLEI